MLILVNDKQIIISVAGNRKATVWKPQSMMWSDFITRVSRPAVSTETMQEYKSMKKAQQDDLKDVGGYVGGTLKDNRRKNGYVIDRCLVTLDADNISPGGTEDILKRVSALGCAYVIYSTRKHTGAAPRLRIVFPLDRSVPADEYEPIARKMAEIIGINIFDGTTFQSVRFMYWSSKCSDAEWVFTYENKPFLSADGILARYGDWRNVAEWPEVPGVQKQIHQGLKKQENPREKQGIIGAFCRIYDVPGAIGEFLTDIYEDCGNGRYTYTAGSTAAGAVLYDDGQFLYSHHSTDPAGDRLCNSFDLVRLHKFGHEDEEATEGTPVNKLPSYKAMCEFALKDEAVKQEKFDTDVACFSKPMEEAGKEPYTDIKVGANGSVTILPTTRNLETMLKNEGIKISYDMIQRAVKVKCQDKAVESQFNDSPNSYGNLLTYCTDQLVRDGLRTSTAKVHEWITKIADDNKVNVARDYLECNYMLYGGVKGIGTLFDCLKINGDSGFYMLLLRKWLCQCVAMAHNEKGQFGADGILVLKGPHGIGKTSFFRKCCIIGLDYFAEGASLDGSKDKLMEVTQNWIAELGELPRSLKDLESLKAFITSATDKFRSPYAKKAEINPRLTSFGATTNSDTFLKEDGERRFWVIEVQDIDLAALDRVSFESVWAEATELYKLLGQSSFRLTSTERNMLCMSNKLYQLVSDEEKLLLEKLDWDQPREQWKEFTATALCELMGTNRGLSAVKVGRALKRIGYDKDSEEYPMRIKNGYSTYLAPSKVVYATDFMTTSE